GMKLPPFVRCQNAMGGRDPEKILIEMIRLRDVYRPAKVIRIKPLAVVDDPGQEERKEKRKERTDLRPAVIKGQESDAHVDVVLAKSVNGAKRGPVKRNGSQGPPLF